MSPERRSPPAQASSDWKGPNSLLNKLHQLVREQYQKDKMLETTEDENTREMLKKCLNTGKENINQAKNDYLQDSLARSRQQKAGQQYNFTPAEKAALLSLIDALTAEYESPSPSNKEKLFEANELMRRTLNPTKGSGQDDKEWEPKRYRVMDPEAEGYDPDYLSSTDEEWAESLKKEERDAYEKRRRELKEKKQKQQGA